MIVRLSHGPKKWSGVPHFRRVPKLCAILACCPGNDSHKNPRKWYKNTFFFNNHHSQAGVDQVQVPCAQSCRCIIKSWTQMKRTPPFALSFTVSISCAGASFTMPILANHQLLLELYQPNGDWGKKNGWFNNVWKCFKHQCSCSCFLLPFETKPGCWCPFFHPFYPTSPLGRRPHNRHIFTC